jgi:hypothetical protein
MADSPFIEAIICPQESFSREQRHLCVISNGADPSVGW